MPWIVISQEEARKHPLFGFTGFIFVIWCVFGAISLYNFVELYRYTLWDRRDELLLETFRTILDGFTGDGALLIRSQLTLDIVSASILGQIIGQIIAFLPFFVLAPTKWRRTPLVAALGLLVGLMIQIGAAILISPIPVLIVSLPVMMLVYFGLVVYFQRSEKVNILYLSRINTDD